ncbi:hypothetical protein GCM10027515_15330 [Schumannella luteola]
MISAIEIRRPIDLRAGATAVAGGYAVGVGYWISLTGDPVSRLPVCTTKRTHAVKITPRVVCAAR